MQTKICLPIIIIASLFAAVIYFVLGSFIGVGYAKFNKRIISMELPYELVCSLLV